MQDTSQIEIRGHLLARPNVCRFSISHPVYQGGRANCSTPETAASSPLLHAIFMLGGIRQIMVTSNSITVEKISDEPWPKLGKKISALIRSHAKPNEPLVEGPLQPSPEVTDTMIQREVFNLIKDQINPQIASHGGYVDLDRVHKGVVYLKMGGGCQGCSAASMTLQLGIERTIYSNVPEVNDIVDVTNHEAGSNPYYTTGTSGHPFEDL